MRFREATRVDAMAIATLHAESWRAFYRGAYRDEYLDGDVFEDRLRVWEERLSTPAPYQFVVLAEENDELIGFASAYGGHDETWGSFLDNIHVRPKHQRRGVGARLMAEVAAWCRANYADCGLYLWVLGLCAKIGLFQSSRSVFVQASISARKPIAGESNHALSASGGISKARTSKIAPTRTRIPR